jgi:hypothetical protein
LPETWEAIRLDHILKSGRTHPVVLDCIHPDKNEQRLMVVKALGPKEITETGLICEMFGNLVARELGVVTPEPALVNISTQMADALRPRLREPFQPGIAVGSEFIRAGMTSVLPYSNLTPEEMKQAADLYAFDLLTQNPDRMSSNPNCAFIGKDIFAYDFESCFSFIYAILTAEQPWEVSKHGWARKHIFYSSLHKKEVNWKPFLNATSLLTEVKIDELISLLPGTWHSKTIKIRGHLLVVAAHLKEFEMELQRSIA